MQQLDPKSFWLFFIGSFISTLFFATFVGIAVVAGAGAFIEILLKKQFTVLGFLMFGVPFLAVAVLVFSFVWAKLSYRFYRYELAGNGFKKESGVIYKRYTTIPYDRIQNVDIYRGIFARILGLSDLHIQTAGGGIMYGQRGMISEGRLPGLSKGVAEELRDQLLEKARQSRTQGL